MRRSILFLGFSFLFSLSCFAGEEPAIFKLEKIKEMSLEKPLEKDRSSFVSAASGLVKRKEVLYSVADDEASLFSFKLTDKNMTVAASLMPPLPSDRNARAKAKPDFESLAFLPSEQWPPHGALIAWPSASGLTRMKASVIAFKTEHQLDKPLAVDILPLAYGVSREMKQGAKELNIEGLVIQDKKVFFFQRGNAGKGKNGYFEIPLANFIKGLKEGDWSGKIKFTKVNVGKLNGVNLTISDAVWTEYGLLALASAEDTISAFADGKVYGSVLLRITADQSEILGKFDPVVKLEGITVEEETKESLSLLMVDDADDPKKTSSVYRVKLNNSQLANFKSKK